jgi:FkbH-like protein
MPKRIDMPQLEFLKDAVNDASVHRLTKAVSEFRKTCFDLSNRASIYVLRNHTIDNLGLFVEGLGYLENMAVSCVQGNYDTIMEDILNKQSGLYSCQPDIIVLSLMFDNFVPNYAKNSFTVDEVMERINQMVENLKFYSSALIVCNTFLMPFYNLGGIVSYKKADSLEGKICEINSGIRRLCLQNQRVYLADWNRFEQKIGILKSRDYRLWYAAQSLLTNKFIKEYAFEIVKLIKALKGKFSKCLVLDCDNTLWGGVIGEDGIDHIQLNPHDYPGNIFYRFQENLLQLANRGVLLTLCSKNNENDVWEVLENHPYCLLKRSNLSAWRINWENKASNIGDLADELNLGIDSFVFIDDNRSECELIKQAFPEVKVLQVPQDLSTYPFLPIKDGLFDTLSVSREDELRTEMYKSEKERKKAGRQYENYDEFLKSLQLIVTVGRVQSPQIPRVAQLTQKTNQFNLTAFRYSETDISKFVENKGCEVLYLHLEDRFGDLGIIGVCILKYEQDFAIIDTFLLSCRALGKKAEDALLDCCLRLAQNKKKHSVVGQYVPTPKNTMVKDFYRKRGFKSMPCEEEKEIFLYEIRKFKLEREYVFKEVIFDKEIEATVINE